LSEEEVDAGIVAIDKSEIISNIDLIKQEGTAILCEGRFDSLTIGDLGGCLHGKVLSDDQFIKLVRNKKKIDQIFIMLDGDAFSYTLYAAERLFQHFSDVYICKLDEKDDPNKIGKRGVLKALNEAIKYTPLFKVKAQLKGWL
jgi:5S rRNA maturation endonuclease (ribonuclease M5)